MAKRIRDRWSSCRWLVSWRKINRSYGDSESDVDTAWKEVLRCVALCSLCQGPFLLKTSLGNKINNPKAQKVIQSELCKCPQKCLFTFTSSCDSSYACNFVTFIDFFGGQTLWYLQIYTPCIDMRRSTMMYKMFMCNNFRKWNWYKWRKGYKIFPWMLRKKKSLPRTIGLKRFQGILFSFFITATFQKSQIPLLNSLWEKLIWLSAVQLFQNLF